MAKKKVTAPVQEESWMEKYEREGRERIAGHRKQLTAMFKKNKIDHAVVEYDGSGDSGNIETVTFYNKKDEEMDVADPAVQEAVENYIYDALPGGWEINEGSFGTATVFADGKAKVEHKERVESYEDAPFEIE